MVSITEDREAIVDVLYRHAEGMDLRDWDGFRSVFPETIEYDYGSLRSGQMAKVPAQEWVDHVRSRLSLIDATQHSISNVRVQVLGDSATAAAYLLAHHVLKTPAGPEWYIVGANYRDRLVRLADGWKLSQMSLDVRWDFGNRTVLDDPESLRG